MLIRTLNIRMVILIMGKTIKIGGVGKNPAIEKINHLNKISNRLDAAQKLEEEVFKSKNGKMQQAIKKRAQIIQDYSIDFTRKY